MQDFFMALTGFGSKKMEEIGFSSFLTLMIISLLCSIFISYLYKQFYESRATGSKIHRAFPLLGISITAIFISIQFSLPLSLGLLGALSIVRFRTPIKEPEEIGFIMVVVAASLCCATFNLLFLGILLIVTVIALLILRFGTGMIQGKSNDGMVIIKMKTDAYKDSHKKLFSLLEDNFQKGGIESIIEDHEGTTVSYNFVGFNKDRLSDMQNNLRNIAETATTNIFFNRSSD